MLGVVVSLRYSCPCIEEGVMGVVVPPGRGILSQYTGHGLYPTEEIRLAVGGAAPVSGGKELSVGVTCNVTNSPTSILEAGQRGGALRAVFVSCTGS